MATDIIWGPTYIAHGDVKKPDSTVFNCVFIDGHAEGVRGGIKRPVQKNPDGSFHTTSGSVVSEMSDAPSSFSTFKNTVWDLDYAAQHK